MGSTGEELALRVGTSLPSSTPSRGGVVRVQPAPGLSRLLSGEHQETWAFLVPSHVSLHSALGNEPRCLLPNISKGVLER